MNHEEIKSWCWDHIRMASRDNDGHGANYIRTFENGDTYEYREIGRGLSNKTVEIIINGILVNISEYVYEEFGWQRTKEIVIA